ncbi:MAG: hypothetical protein ACREGG_02705 [Candidatus Saccharimonadales bacterium]
MATRSPLSNQAPGETNNPGQDEFDKLVEKQFSPGDKRMMEERARDGEADGNVSSNDHPSNEDLSAREENAAGSNTGGPAIEPPTNHTYHPGQPLRGRFSLRGRITKKRAILGGGIVGLIVSLFLLIILSGPAQIVQLAELLQHNFTKSQSDSENRTTHLLRDFKAIKEGDYRYTRVGLIGARVVARVVGQFEDAGVKFTGPDILGRPTGIEIDQSKVAENNPDVKDMNSEEFNSWLNDKFGVDPGTSFTTGTGTEGNPVSKLDISGLKAQAIRSFIGNASTQILGDNAVETAVKTRSLKSFFGLSSLFHPFSTAIQNKIAAKAPAIKQQKPSESDGAAESEAASDIEDSNYDSDLSTLEQPGVQGFTSAKGEEDSITNRVGSKVATGVGLLWATGCTLKGVYGAVVAVNRYLTVLPATVEATSLMSMGSQVQNGGNDITLDQLGATERGFTNSAGQSIWAAPALQSLEGSNEANALTTNSKGQIANDLPSEYKQAFGTNTTASRIREAGDLMLSWFPFPKILGGPCGLLGGFTIIIGGALTNIGLAVANAPDGEAGDAAAQAALDAGENGIIGTIQGQILGPVVNSVVDKIAKATAAPALARSAFSGALGGNLIAYGARAAANSAAILGGGLALANNTSTIIGSAGQEQQQQFNSESTTAKIFNINDYRSLTGRLAMAVSPNPLTDLRLAASSILNIGSIITSISSLFSSHAAAASNSWTGNYDWGFPQYGIPDNMLNDPVLSDPYQNSESVGQYLSSVCTDGNGNVGPSDGACGGGGGYTARIMDCFGNSLTYSEDSDIGGEVWDVAPTATATSASSDVNPNTDTYQNANCGVICPGTIADCGNAGEEQWEKIVMFVNDASNIKALDCLAGYTDTSDQSCTDLGADNGSSSSSTTSSGPSDISAYQNPFRAEQQNGTLVAKRIDQGVDYGGSGPVYAIGNGQLLNTSNSGWAICANGSCSGPNFIVYKLTDGPAAGLFVYVAENCNPNPQLKIKQTVDSNTVLCTMVNAGPDIETGWADGSALGAAMASSVWNRAVDDETHYTAYGLNFSQLMQKLGAPPGTIAPGAQELGTLGNTPAGGSWPSW